ncbi:ABC transporter permease subunit [Paenibacillus sp. J5C2022]|uniref:ABC transporter permease subunit n=1 Tax=Paenibacillus sp. J5C2022 TaxID=2977129 RepID=UPI003978405C
MTATTERTQSTFSRFTNRLSNTYRSMLPHPAYRFLLYILGAIVHIAACFIYLYRRTQPSGYAKLREETEAALAASGYMEKLAAELEEQLRRKATFFAETIDEARLKKEAQRLAQQNFNRHTEQEVEKQTRLSGISPVTFSSTMQSLLEQPLFLILTLLPGLFMYALMALYSNPYLKYIMERLFMTIFVIFGVTIMVFTILYISPMDPAANILGNTATEEQIANFNAIYGLDQPYLVQLWNTIKGILTFDLGRSFAGNENVTAAIANKIPVTLTLTIIATIVAVIIALPIGILSATKPNSFMDYSFMFIALIGLSIPNFWQGLIFILNFSIKLDWLPATYNPNDWMSMIMPVVVLGTALTAAVARMTRSSTLEVIHEDYITTAKAKGLSRSHVLWKHAVTNALIPIVTVIGLQFGGMLGGATVTEKVFNISGIGSYIVDKQFIPDIPAIMGGVIYIAIAISIINVLVDMLYAFLDPRIRSSMKQQ